MKLAVNKENIRIDKYLSDETTYSRELITKMIKEGFILVNNNIAKPSYKTKLNDEIEIDETFQKEENILPEEMSLEIVYEDEHLLVINKPSGLVVHPGNGNKNSTLVNGLKYYTDNLSDIGGDNRVGIVHRLDKDTSGLMLVAKNNKTHELLAEDFKNKKIYREYNSLLIGRFPSDTAYIDAPIGRSKTHFQKQEVRRDGKEARTNLKVIKRYKDYTLVSLVLETGRTHQIRVHTAYIGYPVYNDPIYVNKKATEFGQFLHSKKIKFTHPITHEKLEFECDLPEYFANFLKKLD